MSNHPSQPPSHPLNRLLTQFHQVFNRTFNQTSLKQAQVELLDFYQSLKTPLQDILSSIPLSHSWLKQLQQGGSSQQGPQQNGNSSWLLAILTLLSLALLLLWDWKLLLALVMGVTVMGLVYSLQNYRWEPIVLGLRRWLQGPQRLLLLCIPSGGLAMLGTYMSASVWDSSHDGWLVAAIVIQGLGLGLGLVLLSSQVAGREHDRHYDQLDQLLSDLAAPHAITRLVAVRQLCRLLDRQALTPEQTRMGSQALRLLLTQETEPLVREALLRGLEPRLLQPMNFTAQGHPSPEHGAER